MKATKRMTFFKAKVLIGIITVILTIVLVFTIDGCKSKNEANEYGDVLSEEYEQIEMMQIETAFVPLYYPERWRDNLVLEFVEQEIGQSVVFKAIINSQECWLFTVCFGDADGIPVGAIDSGKGYMIDVNLVMSDYIPDESWSEEDANLYAAMQEDVNYILQNIKVLPSFAE